MSYLDIPSSNVPDFTKAVISLWFRVPQKSIDKANSIFLAETPQSSPAVIPGIPSVPPRQLDGIIPLITFGEIFDDAYVTTGAPSFTYSIHTQESLMSGGCSLSIINDFFTPTVITKPVPGTPYSLNQSFIGIDCTGNNIDNPGAAYLCVRLQTSDYPTMSYIDQGISAKSSNTQQILSTISNVFDGSGHLCGGVAEATYPGGFPGDPLAGSTVFVLSGASFDTTVTYTDYTDVLQNSSKDWFGGTSPTIVVTPDEWHHVLLSFDIGGTVSSTGQSAGGSQTVSSTCSMWVSFDDVNYSGDDMPTQGHVYAGDLTGVTPIAPNNIITKNAWNTFETSNGTPFSGSFVALTGFQGTTTVSGYSALPPTYSFSPTKLPCNKQPMGLPASAEMVDHILNVEMAEFQMFTGVTLDTSVETNRRAFITAKLTPVTSVSASLPVDPTAGVDPTALINPAPPIKLLGKPPAFALVNRSSNWIRGLNTGTSAKGAPSMKSKGKIVPYFPSPKVGK
jgi:hypothetical protein